MFAFFTHFASIPEPLSIRYYFFYFLSFPFHVSAKRKWKYFTPNAFHPCCQATDTGNPLIDHAGNFLCWLCGWFCERKEKRELQISIHVVKWRGVKTARPLLSLLNCVTSFAAYYIWKLNTFTSHCIIRYIFILLTSTRAREREGKGRNGERVERERETRDERELGTNIHLVKNKRRLCKVARVHLQAAEQLRLSKQREVAVVVPFMPFISKLTILWFNTLRASKISPPLLLFWLMHSFARPDNIITVLSVKWSILARS